MGRIQPKARVSIVRWNLKEAGCWEHTNQRANLWSDEQKPHEKDGGTTTGGITYDSTIYGVAVTISTTTSTVGTVTTTSTVVSATYYTLTDTGTTDGSGNTLYTAALCTDVSTSADGEAQFTFTNTTVNPTIKKVDENGNELSGATFTLMNDSSEQVYFVYDDNSKTYTVAASTDNGAVSEITLGSATFSGLSAGTYTLTETSAPDGYNKLTSAITITISGGVITGVKYGDTEASVGSTGSTVSWSGDGTTLTIMNSAGTELPETGGPGTLPFGLAGLLLMSVTGYLIYDTLRRRRIYAS